MATISSLAQMDNNVYDALNIANLNTGADLSNLQNAGPIKHNVAGDAILLKGLSSDWQVIAVSDVSSDFWGHGYFAAAYRNRATGEVVIANRGTDKKNALGSNLLSDFNLGLGQSLAVQEDAVAFALQVKNTLSDLNQLTNGIIETGHSFGGTEAQAAIVGLVQRGGLSTSQVSGVLFNSPGIAGYPIPAGMSASSYNVVDIYNQGDAIHASGGTHLGTTGAHSVMLGAGPDTTALALLAPAAVPSGALGITALLGAALYDILGPAHSLATMLPYLAPTGGGSQVGSFNWTSSSSGASLSGSTVNTALPSFSVDANGDLQIVDPASNVTATVALSSDGQSLNATFSGGASPLAASLATLGVVNVPAAQLAQNLSSLSNAPLLYETISRNSNGTYNVSFQLTPNGVSASGGDHFNVTALNPNARPYGWARRVWSARPCSFITSRGMATRCNVSDMSLDLLPRVLGSSWRFLQPCSV